MAAWPLGRMAKRWLAGTALLFASTPVLAQQANVVGQVEVSPGTGQQGHQNLAGAVVWLVHTGTSGTGAPSEIPASQTHPRLVQKGKSFISHLLVVQAGSAVDFPNEDPFFHNVFSLFDGKRFDLGLYEAGKTRSVVFDRPGICYIFCNIHPEMSAVVVVLQTPYFGISDEHGTVRIPGVPFGEYEVHAWDERALPDSFPASSRRVEITSDLRSVGVLTLKHAPSVALNHKNKYGREYEAPSPDNPVYVRP